MYPDESAEEAPPLHCVAKMLREGQGCGGGGMPSVLQASGCATATQQYVRPFHLMRCSLVFFSFIVYKCVAKTVELTLKLTL